MNIEQTKEHFMFEHFFRCYESEHSVADMRMMERETQECFF